MKKVVIVGGGIAGLSSALDLSLRGFYCTLIEKGQVGCETTTKCAGMLHSGARYIVGSPNVARYCWEESKLLKRNVPFAVGRKQGLFVTFYESNANYLQKFEQGAQELGIDIKRLSRKQCLKLEPNLGRDVSGGYETSDVTINPFVLVDAYKEELVRLGVKVLENHELMEGQHKNGGWSIKVKELIPRYGMVSLNADILINAAGPWSADVATKLGAKLHLAYIHGSMAIINRKLVDRVVSVCGPNAVGDVIVPSGKLSMAGSTWHDLPHNKPIQATPEDFENIVSTAGKIIRGITLDEISDSFTGIRTHVINDHEVKAGKKFSVDRNFAVVDHEESDGNPLMFTILSGKLIYGRLVGEKVGDLICQKTGINRPSVTANHRL